jgi:hypothetical protein
VTEPGPPVDGSGPAPVSCAVCAAQGDGPPPTWSSQTGARGTSWLCERCTRENLRSIEGRLDEAWW